MAEMLLCPFCKRKRVRVNSKTYYFTRYRCDHCKAEWHDHKAYEEGFTHGFSEVKPKINTDR